MFPGVRIGVDAIPDIFLPHPGEGAEEAIPDREDVTVVGVGLGKQVVMMDVMHIWGDDQQAQDAIKSLRETDVGVVEL